MCVCVCVCVCVRAMCVSQPCGPACACVSVCFMHVCLCHRYRIHCYHTSSTHVNKVSDIYGLCRSFQNKKNTRKGKDRVSKLLILKDSSIHTNCLVPMGHWFQGAERNKGAVQCAFCYEQYYAIELHFKNYGKWLDFYCFRGSSSFSSDFTWSKTYILAQHESSGF